MKGQCPAVRPGAGLVGVARVVVVLERSDAGTYPARLGGLRQARRRPRLDRTGYSVSHNRRPRRAPRRPLAALLVAWTLLSPGSAWGQPIDAPGLERLQDAFERLIQRVSPSVVGIRVQRRYVSAAAGGSAKTRGVFEQTVAVNGSGTIISPDGLILTNEHVIQAARTIDVLFHDGRKARALLLASDPRGDLAVIHVNRTGLPAVRFADFGTVKRGQWALAIGNPYGLGRDGQLSVSVGVISNLNRTLPGLGEVDDRFYGDLIQTTAAIYPGCSGGPLFNIRGELVGIVTAMHTRAADDEGVGFAIPMSLPRQRVVRALMRGRHIDYGYIGLTVRAPERGERPAGVAPRTGVIVEKVDPAGPAFAAGIQEGDVLLRFGGRTIRGPASMAQLVGQAAPGSAAPIELLRRGARQTVRLTVGRRQVSHVSWMRGDAILWRGLRLANPTPLIRARLGLTGDAEGIVVIDVAVGSPGHQAGVQIGDVIERFAGQRVEDITALAAQARQQKGAVQIALRGRGEVVVRP